jgi:uncharacterized membrane protein YraQ (UPF0718 family)
MRSRETRAAALVLVVLLFGYLAGQAPLVAGLLLGGAIGAWMVHEERETERQESYHRGWNHGALHTLEAARVGRTNAEAFVGIRRAPR